ncbi:hypothetical protein [Effusibacillus dendaii]|uniref:Proline dehydrogenase n=1 Tax=Effusibacillus dendaii TaxID=2743772 RepID=A0A7I8D980_9BACL|nr:hypothetical protein [Effusibacillus dendaii]BCJ85549.1 hypothetical protein skT53_05340 [Effusibacillus dendaii]
MSNEEMLAASALKSIARNVQIKEYIQNSTELYPLLLRAAKRFVTGETRRDGIAKALDLTKKGYFFSLEYIGENTRIAEECMRAKNEFLELMKETDTHLAGTTISLDLSHIGMSVDSGIQLLSAPCRRR